MTVKMVKLIITVKYYAIFVYSKLYHVKCCSTPNHAFLPLAVSDFQ